MPLSHTSTFRVRFYECDAYGHMNNANYLRYMQEAASEASAAGGFGAERYAEMERRWLIRASEIEYLRPVRYGDTIEVKTWIAFFRRVSSRRVYEFRLAGSEERVARAHTDWVFLDTITGQPAVIPMELREAYFPEGAQESIPYHEPFPGAPAPPEGVFTMQLRVAWKDIDTFQHVNNAVYLDYVEECGMQVIAAHGWPWTRMTTERFAILIRKHQIQYLQPARYGDELELATWASHVRRSTAIRYYTIRRSSDGELLAQVHSLAVWVDLSTGRPIRIPEHFIRDFAPNLVQTEGS